jgi:hypothetical protein
MDAILAEDELESLLTCTKMLMNHVHVVQQSFNLLPQKDHFGTCINYIDLQECRDEFCTELINTVSEWVYSQKKATKIINGMLNQGRSPQNAQAAFTQLTFDKFRDRDSRNLFLQGQFGELLLFNFLQSFFSAVPLLRKMPVTTSSGMERFGADAIHYAYKKAKHLFYLGEGKTYTSKYQFTVAFEDALTSILKTYKNHRKELGLYIYDNFIDDELIKIAQQYKNGTLQNSEVHLVSIIVYNETEKITKNNELQIKADIIKVIEERGKTLQRDIFKIISPELHPRFNYIILPVWELDQFIVHFQTKLGK